MAKLTKFTNDINLVKRAHYTIERQITEALETLMHYEHPVGPRFNTSYVPDFVQSYVDNEKHRRNKPPANSRRATECAEAIVEWGWMLKDYPIERHVLYLRLAPFGDTNRKVPWKKVAKTIGKHPRTAQRYYDFALDKLYQKIALSYLSQ